MDFIATNTLISISGRVTNILGARFSGVTITLGGGTNLTNRIIDVTIQVIFIGLSLGIRNLLAFRSHPL